MNRELTQRINSLKGRLAENRLDAFILSSQESLLYFTGMSYRPEERAFFMIVPRNGVPIFLSPKLEEKHLCKITVESEIRTYWEAVSPPGENWFDILETLIRPFARVGVEACIPNNILQKIPAREIVCSDIVEDMRKVKTPFELAMIRGTAALADKGMKSILANAYIGASILEIFSLSSAIQRELIRGKRYDPVLTALTTAAWPSPNSAMPHSIPGLGDRLTRGSNVAMTYYRVGGYAAECERTFFLDRADAPEKKYFHDMLKARAVAFEMVKPGIKCSDIDAAVRNFLIKQGYEDNLLHRTGHGIGLSNHEKPFISLGDDEELRPDMVISIEPGIYINGVGGYRHSDTVLVTKTGFEPLTKTNTDLYSMTITGTNIAAAVKGKAIRTALGID